MADPKQDQNRSLPPALYMNIMRVRHSLGEFFFDFGQGTSDNPALASFVASLVTSPQHAKLMLKALAQSVETYEGTFGEIQSPELPEPEEH